MISPKKRKPLPRFHACVHLKCSRWSIITQITLDRWAGDFNKKLKEIFHFDFDLPAVFIDTFHRRTNQHEVSVFILQSKIQCNAFTCELFIVCAFKALSHSMTIGRDVWEEHFETVGVRRRETGLALSMSGCSGLMFNYNYFLSEMQDVENICWIQTDV